MINLYRDYLKCVNKYTGLNTKLEETSLNNLLNWTSIINNHIYLNGLTRTKSYAMVRLYNYEKYVVGSVDNADNEYSIFYTDVNIFNHKYTVLIKNTYNYFTWCIYNDDLCLKYNSTLNELKLFTNWLNIDELTDKVNKASDYIVIMLTMIDNINVVRPNHPDTNILLKSNNFTGIQSIINDYYACFNDNSKTNQYDEFYIYKNNKLHKKCFINYSVDGYKISDTSIGELALSLFYFSLDKDRSVLIFNAGIFDNITMLFFKNDKISYIIDIRFLLEVHSLFTLINRKDIFNFLQQINIFKDDTWKQFIA